MIDKVLDISLHITRTLHDRLGWAEHLHTGHPRSLSTGLHVGMHMTSLHVSSSVALVTVTKDDSAVSFRATVSDSTLLGSRCGSVTCKIEYKNVMSTI